MAESDGSAVPRDPATAVAEALVIGCGIWQLWFTFAVRAGLSFSTTVWTLPIPMLAAAALWLRGDGKRTLAVPEPEGLSVQPALATLGVVGLGAVGWHLGLVPWPALWLGLMVHGAVVFRGSRADLDLSRDALRAWHLAVLAGACVLGALATLWIHRPEGDDGYYLAQVVFTAHHADLPLLSFDVLHGDLSLPVQQVAHRASGFETLVSALVLVTGLVPHDVYYLYLPVLFAMGGVIATFVLARDLLGPRAAALAAVAFTLLLPLWGGHHYSFGNYGFARMFQGKAVAVTTLLPLVVWTGIRFAARPTARAWALLVLSQCAAVMATSTALVVAPLAAALAVLPGVSLDRRGLRLAGAGLASALPVVGMLLLVRLDIVDATQLEATGSLKTLAKALGETGYTPLAVLALAALPVVARLGRMPGASWLSRYVPWTTVILLNGALSIGVASIAGDLYSWRLYWAVPFPALFALCLAALGDRALARRSGWAGAFAAALVVVGLSATRSWTADNGANLRFAEWKVPVRERALAEAILERTDPDDLVLAPAAVAVRLTPWVDRPTLLAVRRGYLKHLARELGEDEVDARLRLFGWVNEGLSVEETPAILDALDARCVTVLVTLKSVHESRAMLEAELGLRGFAEVFDTSGRSPQPFRGKYRVWEREGCDG